LSEAETRPREHQALERGGDFTRGGVKPSSEVEIRPRGRLPFGRSEDFVVRRLALERGGVSLEGAEV
jgi:hypothetical protein